MALFGKTKAGGFMDEIRCDEQQYLIWKWHPYQSKQGENNRENAIRWGSPLRVKDGEVAVFVYQQKNGTIQDFILGPSDCKLETKNLPVIASVLSLAYEGGTPFPAEVYFINLAQIVQSKFGVPFFDVYDPRFLDFGVPVAVRGTISFKITDYQQFIKVNRLINFNLTDFQKQVKDAVTRYVKECITNAPRKANIPLVQIESKIGEMNEIIQKDISERLQLNFGVTVSGVDIATIELDKMSNGYRQLMSVTKDVVTTKVLAETEDYVEKLRIQREEGQYAQHKQTQTANFAAFQTDAQVQVGVAGAEALGKMGENGAGSVDLGGGAAGFNPAAMMAGMVLGGSVGQNIAGTMNGIMVSNSQATSQVVPPPIPTEQYHVAINGQATGPYDLTLLTQMFNAGTFHKDSLVWRQGMTEWSIAQSVETLKPIFSSSMPPIPKVE